jgi:hypothetical protein
LRHFAIFGPGTVIQRYARERPISGKALIRDDPRG